METKGTSITRNLHHYTERKEKVQNLLVITCFCFPVFRRLPHVSLPHLILLLFLCLGDKQKKLVLYFVLGSSVRVCLFTQRDLLYYLLRLLLVIPRSCSCSDHTGFNF